MKFKTLIKNTKKEYVWNNFKKIVNCDDSSIFDKIWEELLNLKPVKSEFTIFMDSDVEENYQYHYIYGKKKASDLNYNLSMIPWEEWLSMKIDFNNSSCTGVWERNFMLAHTIWEMTWLGYDNESVKLEIAKRMEILNECE